ncbi:MAG: hypothetical protein IKU88_03040 [Alistipes sp.]|nr:hypothetical protein [Alistipes sp.]
MLAIELSIVAALSLIILWAVWYSSQSLQAEREQELLSDPSIGCHTSIGGVGCSMVCYRVGSLEQIESLLEVTYERYEVIAIADSKSQAELFLTLVTRFHMVEVNNPSRGVSGGVASQLFRSSQRRYRRLVMLDVNDTEDRYSALNQALGIASYNYIIPINSWHYLRPYAIESIAITLTDHSHREPQILLSLGDEPCYIFRRDGVIARGGFSVDLPRKIARREWLYTHQSYIYTPARSNQPNLPTAWLLLLLCIVIFAGWQAEQSDTRIGYLLQKLTLIIAAALSSIIALRAIANWQNAAQGSAKCSARTMLCYFRRFMSIFSRRKFIIT